MKRSGMKNDNQNNQTDVLWKLAISCVCFFCSFTQAKAMQETVTLSERGHFEKCLFLNTNQQIRFSFKTPDPVLFNIHYHHDDQVFYPIANQLTPEYKPTQFTAPASQQYCLMWTNQQSNSVSLTYSLETL